MIGVTGLGANAYSVYIAEKKLGFPSKDSGWYLPTEAQWEYAAAGSEWNENWAEEMIAGCRYDEDYNKYMWSCIIAKTKCAKSENETSKTSLFSLPFFSVRLMSA